MAVSLSDQLPIDVIKASFVANFEDGSVRGVARPRVHFDTDRGYKFYNATYVGREALAVINGGRATGHYRLKGQRYQLIRARVIWALYYGAWPQFEIGHRNEILSDDRIENLRQQTRSDSLITRRLNNRTGVIGVYAMPNGRFYARVTKAGKIYHIGCFDTLEEARVAREKGALKMQGEFARITSPSDYLEGGRL